MLRGAAQILCCVDVQKPGWDRQPIRMSNLAARGEQFGVNGVDRLPQSTGGSLKRRKAPSPPGIEFSLETGQDGSVQHRWKRLSEPGERGQRDCAAASLRVG